MILSMSKPKAFQLNSIQFFAFIESRKVKQKTREIYPNYQAIEPKKFKAKNSEQDYNSNDPQRAKPETVSMQELW